MKGERGRGDERMAIERKGGRSEKMGKGRDKDKVRNR